MGCPGRFIGTSCPNLATLSSEKVDGISGVQIGPGATAYLLTDRFGRLILISVALGMVTSFAGAYISFFLDGATGGVIVTLQTLLFIAAFYFAPKHGVIAARRRRLDVVEADA